MINGFLIVIELINENFLRHTVHSLYVKYVLIWLTHLLAANRW